MLRVPIHTTILGHLRLMCLRAGLYNADARTHRVEWDVRDKNIISHAAGTGEGLTSEFISWPQSPFWIHLRFSEAAALTRKSPPPARLLWKSYATEPVQVRAILIEELPPMTQLLGFESEPYSGNWSLVNVLDGFALDRKIRASGWNFFFMGAEERSMSLVLWSEERSRTP